MIDTDNNAAPANARLLIRTSFKAALATLDPHSGAPYASLVTVATDPTGAPVFLISELAKHTHNLSRDNRISLLFDGTDYIADPLAGPRVSVSGRAVKDERDCVRMRFLRRHPEAAAYADFTDFSYFRLAIEHGHYVGGFGRIHDLGRSDLECDITGAEALIECENQIVDRMNKDHADSVRICATRLLGAADGHWRLSGCDVEGCDLMYGERALRLVFPDRVTSPDEAQQALMTFAEQTQNA